MSQETAFENVTCKMSAILFRPQCVDIIPAIIMMNSIFHYLKTSSISRTKSQNSNVSCILLQLSSLNPLKPGVKLRMKM